MLPKNKGNRKDILQKYLNSSINLVNKKKKVSRMRKKEVVKNSKYKGIFDDPDIEKSYLKLREAFRKAGLIGSKIFS